MRKLDSTWQVANLKTGPDCDIEICEHIYITIFLLEQNCHMCLHETAGRHSVVQNNHTILGLEVDGRQPNFIWPTNIPYFVSHTGHCLALYLVVRLGQMKGLYLYGGL